jgi:hypothetical protein
MKITTTPEVVWEKCALHIVGPLNQTLNGDRYVLKFQDELSKFTLAVPIRQQGAVTVAKAFVEEIVLKFGIPQTILTDQGSNFMSEVFVNVCKRLKIEKIKCTAFHPQIDGSLERTHRVLVEYLRCFILEYQSNWDQWLSYATFVFNTTPHTSTGFTRTNCFSAGNLTYRECNRRTPPTLSTLMIIMSRNCSLVCNQVIR